MASGKGFTFDLFGDRTENPLESFLPPLFPAVNYVAIQLFEDSVRGLSLIHIALGTISVAFLFVVGCKLSDNVVIGLLAALAFALYPVFIIQTIYPPSLTINLFLLLGFLAVVVSLRQRPSVWLAVLAGFVLGLGLLTRTMFVGLIPIAFVWLWLNRPKSRKRTIGLTAIIILFTFLTVLPWTIRNYRIHERFVLVSTNGGFVFWNGNNPFTTGSGHEVITERAVAYLGIEPDPDFPAIVEHWQPYPLPRAIAETAATMDELALEDAFYAAGFDFIRQHPDRWFELAQAKLLGFWFFRENVGSTYEAAWTQYYKLGYVAVLLTAFAGAIITRRQWRRYLLLYMIFAYYTLVYTVFHVQTRYRWEIEPLFLILVSVTVYAVGAWMWQRLSNSSGG
jgi:4-amino-4-deoxy-L-arabinose transferase-like glycosyltransferase